MGGEFRGHGNMYMYGWISLLFIWNYHNMVNWLYANTKQKVKKKLTGMEAPRPAVTVTASGGHRASTSLPTFPSILLFLANPVSWAHLTNSKSTTLITETPSVSTQERWKRRSTERYDTSVHKCSAAWLPTARRQKGPKCHQQVRGANVCPLTRWRTTPPWEEVKCCLLPWMTLEMCWVTDTHAGWSPLQ